MARRSDQCYRSIWRSPDRRQEADWALIDADHGQADTAGADHVWRRAAHRGGQAGGGPLGTPDRQWQLSAGGDHADRTGAGGVTEAAQAMHPEQDDVQEMFAADCRFHATILDATGNGMLRQMRQLIVTMLRVSYDFAVLQHDVVPSRDGHIRVAEAIAARQGETARVEMARMLELNRRDALSIGARLG